MIIQPNKLPLASADIRRPERSYPQAQDHKRQDLGSGGRDVCHENVATIMELLNAKTCIQTELVERGLR